jgi:putative membrane protein
MNKKLAGAGALLLLLATPAFAPSVFAQSVGEKTGVNSTLGIAPKTQDFVTEAANSDMLEIATSKLVAGKADTKDKSFAEQMIKDHTATSDELKALVGNGKVKADLPTAMDKAHQSKLDDLAKRNGDDFRKQYEDMQVSAHKDAVSLFERYAKGGDNADLKDWAGKTLPKLQGHLKMAQDLNK